MSSLKLAIAALCLVGVCFIASAVGKTMPDDTDLASLLQDSEVISDFQALVTKKFNFSRGIWQLANVDDGSIETALLN